MDPTWISGVDAVVGTLIAAGALVVAVRADVANAQSAVDRLRVAFQAAAESSTSPEEKGVWRSLVEQITVGVGTSLGVEIGKRILGIDS